MRGIDVFCERCGARQPTERREVSTSGGAFARRLLGAVNRTTADGVPAPATSGLFLRLCLECRGYSCPVCWNDEVGLCQTCAPLPEPEPLPLPTVEVAPVAEPPVAEPPPVVQMAPAVEALVVEARAEPVPLPEALPEPLPEPMPVAEVIQVAAAAEVVAPPEPVTPPVIPAEPIAQPAPVVAPPPPVAAPQPIANVVIPAPVRPPVSDRVIPAPVVLPRPVQPSISFDMPALPMAPPGRAYLPPPPRPGMTANPVTGVRPCRSCHLPLSAKAHFCRRCGTAQES